MLRSYEIVRETRASIRQSARDKSSYVSPDDLSLVLGVLNALQLRLIKAEEQRQALASRLIAAEAALAEARNYGGRDLPGGSLGGPAASLSG